MLILQETLKTFNILDIFLSSYTLSEGNMNILLTFLKYKYFCLNSLSPSNLLTLLYANTVNATCSFVLFRALLWIFLVHIKLILTWNYVHMLEIIHHKAIFILSENALDIRILLWSWTDNYTAENITLKFFLLNYCSHFIKFYRQLYTWCAIRVLHNPNVSKSIPRASSLQKAKRESRNEEGRKACFWGPNLDKLSFRMSHFKTRMFYSVI